MIYDALFGVVKALGHLLGLHAVNLTILGRDQRLRHFFDWVLSEH